jgi:hypothetical protein
LWKESIILYENGEPYEALKTLGHLARTTYNDGTDDPNRRCVKDAIVKIGENEKNINVAEMQARSARVSEHRNREAGMIFEDCQDKIQSYMQKVGYYLMMNKAWDNRITPTATMKTELAPPKSKTYKEKLPSELL